jgi:large subunit ribosomal protein L36e
MERSTDPERESDDDRARIFCGSGYTTESRIERSRTPVQGGYYGEAGSGFGREDGRGILRIIEVDVESGPGQAISR